MKKVLKLLAKIPERHYFPIFIILSLYFIVPYSEYFVTLLAPFYFIFEVPIRSAIGKVPLPPWLIWGGSLVFFLVMMDDTLLYFALIALAFWSAKQVKKENVSDQKSLSDESLDKS